MTTRLGEQRPNSAASDSEEALHTAEISDIAATLTTYAHLLREPMGMGNSEVEALKAQCIQHLRQQVRDNPLLHLEILQLIGHDPIELDQQFDALNREKTTYKRIQRATLHQDIATILRKAIGRPIQWPDLYRLPGKEPFEDGPDVVATSLIDSVLQDHPSHGPQRMEDYMASIETGWLKPDGECKLTKRGDNFTQWNGNQGFGAVCLQLAFQDAAEQLEAGKEMYTASIRDSYHAGRAEWIGRQAAQLGHAAIVMLNLGRKSNRCGSPGAKVGRYGTEAFCMAVPYGDEGIVVDFSPAKKVEGKVNDARINGIPIIPGVLIEPDGTPTSDPNALYRKKGAAILQSLDGFRGAGFAMLIQLMVDLLSRRMPSHNPPKKLNSSTIMLWNLAKMGDRDKQERVVQNFVDLIKSTPTLSGEPLWLPGERGYKGSQNDVVEISEGTFEIIDGLRTKYAPPIPVAGHIGDL